MQIWTQLVRLTLPKPLSANPRKWANTLKQFKQLFECV